MSTPQKQAGFQFSIAADKASAASRDLRGDVIATMVVNTDTYKNVGPFKVSADALIASTAVLKTAVKASTQADAEAVKAHGVRNSALVEFDACYDYFLSNVRRYCLTPDMVKSVGCVLADPAKHTLEGPVSISAKFDGKKEVIRLHVHRPPGNTDKCAIEVSTVDPPTPESYKLLPGNGAVQPLGGYAPGRVWIRAALKRAKEQSAWSDPVSVLVK